MIVSSPLKVWSIPNSYRIIQTAKFKKNPNNQLQSSNESITIGTIEDYESTEKMIVSNPLKVRLIPNSYRIIQTAKFEKTQMINYRALMNR
jgi:hypothetical protein